MIRILLLAVLFTCCMVPVLPRAAEQKSEQPAATSEETVTDKTEDVLPPEELPEEPQVAQPPDNQRLKRRELGEAFGRFTPSEAISTDNAVPFPVDI